MGSTIRGVVRLALWTGWTLMLLPVQVVSVALGSGLAETIPLLYHRGCCHIIGLDVVSLGKISETKPTLFVSNHISYLDITVLASMVRLSFIAKSEVATWPLFGLLAKLQRSVFVERRPVRTAHHRDEIAARLDAGDRLVLFAEGTSSDGNRVLPFKSALFSVAERTKDLAPLAIQPVSIAYVRLDGLPLGREWRAYYAWYGDMDMASHFWKIFTLGRVTVEVRFHPPVFIADIGNRKALSDYCHRQVAQGVTEALTGGRDRAL